LRLYAADFCAARGTASGTYGVIVGHDANGQVVPVTVSHNLLNECRESWVDLLEPSVEYYGRELVDTDTTVWCSDGDKGAKAALEATMEHSRQHICREHRGETAAKRFRNNAKYLFTNFADSTTQAEQDAALRKIDEVPGMRAWVDQLPRLNQCRLQNAGLLHGRNTSNQVESQNWAMMEVRRCSDPFYGLQRIIERGEEMYIEHAALAAAPLTHVVPTVRVELEKLEQESRRKVMRVVWTNRGEGVARVYRVGEASAYYTVCIGDGEVSCTCGVPFVDRKMCVDLVAVLKQHRTRGILECVFPEDTARRHKEQYNAGGKWNSPDLHEVASERTGMLMPLSGPMRRGAPKKKRPHGRRDALAKAYGKALRKEGTKKQTLATFPLADEDKEDEDDEDFDADVDDDDDEEEEDDEFEEEEEEEEEDDDDDDNTPIAEVLPRFNFRATSSREATSNSRGFGELPGSRAA
jgi:hypothetical protein